ncbi:TetR family transcriptional regulator [Pseudomonas sp. FME51]|uniref:TetR family transcriptional regulator n=1 Tax=Pseudomonas sp. FME51 TaxID=2742609 RepID=UPI0018691B48|nr:TetR family transcriptional regulator [Pseudomonas sp. FME51]
MARRTKQEALETRNQIIDAAELCFFKKGVSHTSLAEIAKTAGVTRGAIYWHFENKGEVLDALLVRAKTPIQHLEEASRNSDEPDPLGRLQAMIVEVFRQAERDPTTRRINEIVFHKCEYTDQMCDLREYMRQLRLQSDSKLESALRNAISKGQLAAELDVPMAARSLHAFVIGMLDIWLLRPEDFSLAERADQLARTVIEMLQNSPAMRPSEPH